MICETCEKYGEITDHEDRIKTLELADAETKTELKNLIKQVEKLVETMEKFMGYAWKILLTVAGFGMAFIIWYIQSK